MIVEVGHKSCHRIALSAETRLLADPIFDDFCSVLMQSNKVVSVR